MWKKEETCRRRIKRWRAILGWRPYCERRTDTFPRRWPARVV